MLHYRDGIGQMRSGAWFPPDMTLGIQAKEFNLCFICPENLVSDDLRFLQVSFTAIFKTNYGVFYVEC